jgi:hypothetical protein
MEFLSRLGIWGKRSVTRITNLGVGLDRGALVTDMPLLSLGRIAVVVDGETLTVGDI